MWFVLWVPVGLALLGAVHLGWGLGSSRVSYRWLRPVGGVAAAGSLLAAARAVTGPDGVSALGGVAFALACAGLVVAFAAGVGWIIGTSDGRMLRRPGAQLVAVWITWVVVAAPWLVISYGLDTWSFD